MALPPDGWVEAQRAEVVGLPLPEDLVLVYEDSGFRGRPTRLFSDEAGDPLVTLLGEMRYMKVEILIRNVYDVALVDRIE